MSLNSFYNTFDLNRDKVAIIWKDNFYTYDWLITEISNMIKLIESSQVETGSKVAIIGDFTPKSIALLFAMIEKSLIITPLTFSTVCNKEALLSIANVEYVFNVDNEDTILFEFLKKTDDNVLYAKIKKMEVPGLVLFTSGTSGQPKCAVHNFHLLLEKFNKKRNTLKTLNFLLFDHWGGLNTMFHILSNNGTLIATKNRSPDNICKLIEKYKIQLLPATPTFLNLLLISESYKNYDLSSLEIISYGTEPMPESTLHRLALEFPKTKLLQTYGLIELGVMRSKSEDNNSLWVKIEGEGYLTRIVDGILQIKSESAMLGYLNAENPFTEDGWFITGDEVIQKGEYLRILGRRSEIINVGGEKVYPQEVESVIQEMPNIAEVTVYGEKNSIVGNIVCARIRPKTYEDNKDIVSRIKKDCRLKLPNFKVPVKIIIDNKVQYSERIKKKRS